LEEIMTLRIAVLFCLLFVTICAATDQKPVVGQSRFPANFIPSGKTMFRLYCAACHGPDGKGRGPVTASLNARPPDLTVLAKNHGGIFPFEYVAGVLRFGPGLSAHGSSEMPTWGPIFQYLDNHDEASVRQRIKNLCDYLESIQVK
jgi:mono/diheme cytochrome c family protein